MHARLQHGPMNRLGTAEHTLRRTRACRVETLASNGRRLLEHAADLPITGADYSGLSELVQKLYSSDVPSRDLLTFGLRCRSPPEATSQPGSRWMAFPPPLPHETGAVLWVSQSRYSLLGQPQAGSRLTSSFAPYVGGEVDILLLQAHGNSQNFISFSIIASLLASPPVPIACPSSVVYVAGAGSELATLAPSPCLLRGACTVVLATRAPSAEARRGEGPRAPLSGYPGSR